MDVQDTLWFLVFIGLFFITNGLIYCLRSYLKSKPLGYQSLYDVLEKDLYFVLQVSLSIFTLEAALSRQDDFIVQDSV